MNPLMLMLAFGGKMFGGGMLKKILFFTLLGPLGLLLGGGFSIKDFILIPMLAPMFAGILPGV